MAPRTAEENGEKEAGLQGVTVVHSISVTGNDLPSNASRAAQDCHISTVDESDVAEPSKPPPKPKEGGWYSVGTASHLEAPPTPKKKDEELPKEINWYAVGTVLAIVAADAVTLIGPLPFFPRFCHDQLGVSDEDVGVVVGIVAGSYSLANFFSGVFIGHMSDLYGRMPFLILGLTTSVVCTLLLGLCQSVFALVVCRAVVGLLNCNFSVSRAALADIVPNGSRAVPFAYMGATFGLSRTLASAIGGLSVGIFWTEQYGPFVSPCIVLSIPAILALLMTCGMKEPNKKRRYTSILQAVPGNLFGLNKEHGEREREMERMDAVEGGRGAGESNVERTASDEARKESFLQKWGRLTEEPLLMRLIWAQGMMHFANGSMIATVILFTTTQRDHHGMGMSEKEAGFVFALMGFVGFLFQVALFKRASDRFGLRILLKVGLLCLFSGCFAMPLAAALLPAQPAPETPWLLLSPSLFLFGGGLMLCLPVVATILSNATPAHIQGLTQGLGQSTSSLLRAFGPFASGALFTSAYAFNAPAMSFALLAVAYAISIGLTFSLPVSVEETTFRNRTLGLKAGALEEQHEEQAEAAGTQGLVGKDSLAQGSK